MNSHRLDLQALAQAKLADASLLYQNQRYSNACYLYGDAVEAVLKAKLASSFLAGAIRDKKLVNAIYTHDLNRLLDLAGTSAFTGRHGIYLEDLFTRPAFRGHGLGKALLARLARRKLTEAILAAWFALHLVALAVK